MDLAHCSKKHHTFQSFPGLPLTFRELDRRLHNTSRPRYEERSIHLRCVCGEMELWVKTHEPQLIQLRVHEEE